MNTTQEHLRVLRQAGEKTDDKINLAETALSLAALDRPEAQTTTHRQHLAAMVDQLQAEGPASRLDDQIRRLRRVIVIQNKYQGDDKYAEDPRAHNLMEVIDRRTGSPAALGLIYLHLADAMGWAMTGLDLAGHFLLRLSAADGQIVIDPFRAGQACQIVHSQDDDFWENADAVDEEIWLEDAGQDPSMFDLSSELLRPLTKREILLRLQHAIKGQHLSNERVDAAIATLQGMILFAPKDESLWRELGGLQAERGHIRAAITALEVVRGLCIDPPPHQKTDGMLRELRWRLN